MKKVGKRLLWLGLLALLAYAAVYSGYRWLAGQFDAALGPEPAREARKKPQAGVELSQEAAIQAVLQRNIFAVSVESGKAGALSPAGLQGGPLELLGTIAGPAERARAILKISPDGPEQLYRLGDRVRGAEIVRIERGKVELKTAAGAQILLLKERAPESEAALAAGPADTDDTEAGQEEWALPDEGAVLEELRLKNGRIVPQAMPGRRVESSAPAPLPPGGAASGLEIRTGAGALAPREMPLSPEDQGK